MCTVTWLSSPDRLQVFFNRDERRTRLPGIPPEIHQHNGVRYLAPTDAEAGGAWIGVNEFGLAAGIVNHYLAPPPPSPADPRSRGLLLADLLDCPDPGRVQARLAGLALDRYPPFQLAAFAGGEEPWHWTWNGRRLAFAKLGPDRLPLTTSSFETEDVLSARRQIYQAMVNAGGPITGDRLRAFHRRHDPARPAHSVCMSRPDARTVSFTEVSVTASEVSLRYLPDPLDAPADAAPTEVRLPRIPSPSRLLDLPPGDRMRR